MFSDCNFDSTACNDCYTGSVNCSILTCFEDGFCLDSTYLTHKHVMNVNECLEFCQSVPDCEYFSFNPDDNNICVLTLDCINIDSSCVVSGCQYGQVSCEVDYWSNVHIMIASGTEDYSPITDTEVIDTQTITSCPNFPPNFPYDATYPAVLKHNSHMVICGGGYYEEYPDCYSYYNGQWNLEPFKLQPGRYNAISVEIRPGEWLIMGGHNDNFGYLSETQLFKDGIFTDGPEMPLESGGGSAVMLNETHLFVALAEPGGPEGYYLYNYLLDINSDQWVQIADRTVKSTTYHASGTFYNSTAGEIQVGFIGWNGIEVYSPRDNSWHSGIPFPPQIEKLFSSKAIQQGRNSFILIGGQVGPDYEVCGHIFLFDEHGLSILKEDVLTVPRSSHAAMPISKEDFICK